LRNRKGGEETDKQGITDHGEEGEKIIVFHFRRLLIVQYRISSNISVL